MDVCWNMGAIYINLHTHIILYIHIQNVYGTAIASMDEHVENPEPLRLHL